MIGVKITLNVIAEKHKEVLQTLRSLIKRVEKETGCKNYAIFCDIDDKNSICILEEWETQKDLNQHIKTLRFGVLLGTKPLLRESPEIQIYTITRIQGMALVESLRNKGARQDDIKRI